MGRLLRRHSSEFVNRKPTRVTLILLLCSVNLCPASAFEVVLPQVTFPAQKLEVIEAQCDLRIRNVEWCQLLDMMHDDTRLVDPATKTVLAQMMSALSVFVPAILPCL